MDQYGGSFENRARLILEIVERVRGIIPDSMPVLFRISATDWLEDVDGFGPQASWTYDDTAKLAQMLVARGVDIVDVIISGKNHPKQLRKESPGNQARISLMIKEALGDRAAVSAVGGISSGKEANGFLDDGLDLVMAGRAFLRQPNLVGAWADELGVKIHVAKQFSRA